MDIGAFYGLGINAFVGLGNRLDIDENELLEYFKDDQATSAVALYLESFADPKRFIEIAREFVLQKPLVFLRAGRSYAGARAVQSHTGSLAGSDRVTDGMLRQLGILRVYDADQLLETANALAYSRPVKGRRVAIVTGGGGMGIMTADYIEAKENGIASKLATLQPETESKLKEVALPIASVHNPIDLTASVTSAMYDGAIGALQDDPGVDVIICVYDYNPSGCDERLTESLIHWAKEGSKPLVAAVLGSELCIDGIRTLSSAGVPAFSSIWSAVRAVDALAKRNEFLEMVANRQEATVDEGGKSRSAVKVVSGVPLAEDQIKAVLSDRGINTPKSVVLSKGILPTEVPLAYPVVVKIRSAAVLHKTELKGVVLDVRDRASVEVVAQEMAERFPGEDLLVEEMEPKGVELIVGLIEDATLGLAIMCGLGGTLAELFQDVAFRLIPIDKQEAENMLRELKGYALLNGFRGIEANRKAVIDLLVKVSQLGQELAGSVDQIDLNPVIVHGDKAVVVDAKIIWKNA
jgi:acetyltransferase